MDAEIVMQFINETPKKFLRYVPGGKKVIIEGVEYRITRNNIRGGLEVFSNGSVFHFDWDKKTETWFLNPSR